MTPIKFLRRCEAGADDVIAATDTLYRVLEALRLAAHVLLTAARGSPAFHAAESAFARSAIAGF